MSVEIKLKRHDRVYMPGETVSGCVVVTSSGTMSHNGISLLVEGSVQLQLSAKSVGIFEAFYNQLQPIELVRTAIEISGSGKLPAGRTELPFEFPLEAVTGQKAISSYAGVYINVGYNITCEIPRPLLAKNIKVSQDFIVETAGTSSAKFKPAPVPFTITPESLENVRRGQRDAGAVPQFRVVGRLDSAVCAINAPFTGELTVQECNAPIKSIEVQLVRVETTGSAEGFAKEATEIQNVQLAEGDVCRNLAIPIYMIFPRLFTCPTVSTRTFKIEFEVNLVILFEDGHLITENFQIKLFRKA
jgi:hypothetical protein|eukprot:TRINITY_DN5181_c0_g1_i1.p2 TRINITY_DN5181_c0_g1~~TRINITY_DN5181_c0_g1_i1.p2  ORF type:complete len:302 (+),score=129.95 TRINITY_DN5181_c0_g1_i1:167-1072(+)